MSNPHRKAPEGALPTTRPLDDRIGEMLRRHHHGTILPLWADAPEIVKQYWCDRAPAYRTLLASCGLKVVVDEGER